MASKDARFSRVFLFTATVGVLALSACSSSSSSGSAGASGGTSAPYVIGEIGSTNAAAAGFEEWRAGVSAYFNTVNSAGGLHGRKIQMIFKDDANFDTQTEISYYTQLTQAKALAIMGLTLDSSIPVIAAKGESSGVPIIVGSAAERAIVDPVKQYEYGFTPDFRQYLQAMAGAASQSGIKKVAVVVIDSAESREAAGYLQQILPAKYGMQVVNTQFTPLTATNFTAEVQAAQQAGAQAVLTIQSPSDTVLVAHAMEAQKYNVPIYGVPADTGVAKSVAALGITYWAVAPEEIDTTSAGYKAAAKAAQQYGFTSVLNLAPGQFLNGWVSGQVVAKALDTCGAACDSPQQFNKALQQVSGLTTGELTPPLSISSGNHSLTIAMYPWHVLNGTQSAGASVSSAP